MLGTGARFLSCRLGCEYIEEFFKKMTRVTFWLIVLFVNSIIATIGISFKIDPLIIFGTIWAFLAVAAIIWIKIEDDFK